MGGIDMKTIEERAKEYASKKGNISLSPIYNEALARIYEEAYIAGAAEQKAIDIDNACDWLKENARDYACATVRCPYGEEEEIICDVHPEIVEDFRKAMEE